MKQYLLRVSGLAIVLGATACSEATLGIDDAIADLNSSASTDSTSTDTTGSDDTTQNDTTQTTTPTIVSTQSIVGSCPQVVGEGILASLDFGTDVERLAGVADDTGVFAMVESTTLAPATKPLVFVPCDGSAQTELATFSVLDGPFNPNNLIAQDEDSLYIAEAGTRIVQVNKLTGAEIDVATGEVAISSLETRLEGGTTVIAWIANDELKFQQGATGVPQTVATSLRDNSLAPECTIAGIDSTDIFVVCEESELRRFSRNSTDTAQLFEAGIIEDVTAQLIGNSFFMIYDRECDPLSPDCFLTEDTIAIRGTADSGGIVIPENLDVIYDEADIVHATADRLIIEGQPKNLFSLSQRALIDVPLNTGTGVTVINGEGDFIAGDERNVYYAAGGNLVVSGRNNADVGTAVTVPDIGTAPSCPAIASSRYVTEIDYGTQLRQISGAADNTGVYLIPEGAGVTPGFEALRTIGCGGSTVTSLGNFAVTEALTGDSNTEVVLGETTAYIVETGATLYSLPKAGGAPTQIVTGEVDARSLTARVEAGIDQLFWVSGDMLRAWDTISETVTNVTTGLPVVGGEPPCEIDGVSNTSVFLTCQDNVVLSVDRIGGLTTTLFDAPDAEEVAGFLRGDVFYMTRGRCPTVMPMCEPSQSIVELYRMPADGSATPSLIRSIDAQFESAPEISHSTATHLILNGDPEGALTTMSPSLVAVPLDEAGRTEYLAFQAYFVAGDDNSVYYLGDLFSDGDLFQVSP
ncbi:MAG: hypothetical protein AAFY84_09710 [Pseudomonadota bacterium]